MADHQQSSPQPKTRRLRWSWFPSLLLGDGMVWSVIILLTLMLRRFGMNNAQVTLYVALMSSALVLRPIFERIVTYFKGTTKVWILSAEFIAALSLWATAFTLPTSFWLQGIACFIPFTILSGIFYNIAVERFYLDHSPTYDDSVKSRIAMLFRILAMLIGVGGMAMLAGNMEVLTRNIRYSWSFVLYIMAGIQFFLWLWHSIFLPGGNKPYAEEKDLYGLHNGEYGIIVNEVTHGLRNRMVLYFFLLFLLPEAFLCIMTPLFIIDAPHNGGLGLSPQELALSYGTIGAIAIFLGNTLSTRLIKRFGLRYCAIPMTLCLSLHALSLLYLSYNLASTLAIICIALFIGNAALGIGVAPFFSALGNFAQRHGGILRSSIARALASLTMVIISMFSGLLQINIGYRQFLIIASMLYGASLAASILLMCSTIVKHNNYPKE